MPSIRESKTLLPRSRFGTRTTFFLGLSSKERFLKKPIYVGPEGSMDLAHLLFRLQQWEATETALSQVPFQEKVVLLAQVKYTYPNSK